MAEFVIKLADERGRVMEQVQTASTADELRARFTHAGYHVFSVKARGGLGGFSRRKVKLEQFLVFNQQFLTSVAGGHASASHSISGLSICTPSVRTSRTRS